ncbi:hypothetical protein [Burkholderia pseudomallei]|jgi:hypothetical protein|uniref:hypothetical protein n=1 Tax=Burkholderia pseudomallei TaxID=28450 RepID=UPI0024DFAACA|nr:hypothetical protein [Burkholderia pseudomallei]
MVEVLAVVSVIILIFLPSIIALVRGCKYFMFVQILMVLAVISNSGDYSAGLWGIALIVSLYKTQTKTIQGPRGPMGVMGMSAYDTWLKLGNRGTEQDFINFLKKG